MANLLRGGESGQGTPIQSGLNAGGALSITSMVSSMEQSITQSLQSSGASPATEQLMRTLITVMVLLALLDQTQRSNDFMNSAAGLLALGAAGNELQAGITSSTMISSFEQSTMTISLSNVVDYAQFSGSAAPPTGEQGGQLDISV